MKSKPMIDRPFDPALLKQARAIARRYTITLEPSEELGYMGSSFEMPLVFADGKTPGKCVEETLESLTVAVATMMELNRRVPLPASDDRRTEQVNVRLTAMEKARLEAASRSAGFRGLSDYIRYKALANSASPALVKPAAPRSPSRRSGRAA